jgi:Uncharacterized conserved protein (DUF2190)
MTMRHDDSRAFTIGAGGVANCRLVKLLGLLVVLCTATATDDPIGVCDFYGSEGDDTTVRFLGDDTLEMTAAGPFAAGADLFAAADGKVQALPAAPGTYRRVAKSLESADADGDIVECLPYNDGKTATVS